ncbi:Uncharacterised protein [Shigella sonnei]|nr:Uncharacterised protein [Shigella sonnei]CST09869.1 Uncharacterised protein [Shigella sonnei]
MVAANSVAIPVNPSKSVISSPSGNHNPRLRPYNMPMARPINSVGVKTPPGAPEPLLASTAHSLQRKIPAMIINSGGAVKKDCTVL